MTMNKEIAKKTWENAGLTAQGVAAINAMIDKLSENIEAGKGRFDAYAKLATFESDPMGSVQVLSNAIKQTSK